MLIGISKLISPDLIKILMEMGHGDEIVLADANFPAANMAQRLVRCDGHSVPDLLDAILRLFPLDEYVAKPAALMEVVSGDAVETPIWATFENIIHRHQVQRSSKRFADFEYIERFAFYERAKQAYAIIATGESAQYANIILRKGVIVENAN